MKRIILAGVLAVALLGLSRQTASAAGFGSGGFSFSVGFNVNWDFSGGKGCGACYGPSGYPAPAMYQAWGGGYGGGHDGGYGGGYGGYPVGDHGGYGHTGVPVYGY